MRHTIAAAAAAALGALAVALAGAAAAGAIVTGIGEQNTGFFDDASFEALRIDVVRVVVPWDAALTGDARTQAWIGRALERDLVPLVAFERGSGAVCPGARCDAPSAAAYEAALMAFRERWPQITQLTPWNEPNHGSQPTSARPGLAAQYYNVARRVCPQCTLVAGDVLDDGNLVAWLTEYKQMLDEQPAVWGLHNYYDATYFTSGGLDTLERHTTGDIWLTETGGIVRFSPAGGGGLPYDEQRAADSIRWLYAMTATRPRVRRMYLYHWQGRADNDFDAGLVGLQGEARPGLGVVRAHAARAARPRPATDATAARVVLRISDRGLRLVRRGLRLRVACVSAPRRCSGRVVVTLPPGSSKKSYRPRLLMNFDLRPGQSVLRHLSTSRRVRRALLAHFRLQVTYCAGGMRACRTLQRRLIIRAP